MLQRIICALFSGLRVPKGARFEPSIYAAILVLRVAGQVAALLRLRQPVRPGLSANDSRDPPK